MSRTTKFSHNSLGPEASAFDKRSVTAPALPLHPTETSTLVFLFETLRSSNSYTSLYLTHPRLRVFIVDRWAGRTPPSHNFRPVNNVSLSTKTSVTAMFAKACSATSVGISSSFTRRQSLVLAVYLTRGQGQRLQRRCAMPWRRLPMIES